MTTIPTLIVADMSPRAVRRRRWRSPAHLLPAVRRPPHLSAVSTPCPILRPSAATTFATWFNDRAGFAALTPTEVPDTALWAWMAELLDSPTWGLARPEVSGPRGQVLVAGAATLCRQAATPGCQDHKLRPSEVVAMTNALWWDPLTPQGNGRWPGAAPAAFTAFLAVVKLTSRLDNLSSAAANALEIAEDGAGAATCTTGDAEAVMAGYGLAAATAWRRLAGCTDPLPTVDDFAYYATKPVARWVDYANFVTWHDTRTTTTTA